MGMASLGMALQPANDKVGDLMRYDSDQDSDEYTADATPSSSSSDIDSSNNNSNSNNNNNNNNNGDKTALLSEWGFAPGGSGR